MQLSTRRGFTLIELLVVISIIAILASVGLVVYSGSQKIARDSRRKLDLKAIATALELYYQKNGAYPSPPSSWAYSNATQPWIPGLDTNYINFLPTDPRGNGTVSYSGFSNYGYAYWSAQDSGSCPTTATGQYYVLMTVLENKNDPDRLGLKDQKYCDGRGLYSTYGYYPYLYIITSP